MDVRERRTRIRKLHESGCLVIPNPWDVGTARYLGTLGFQALATTSSGFSFSRGEPDADWAVPRDVMVAHVAEIVAATELPVNADSRSGYAPSGARLRGRRRGVARATARRAASGGITDADTRVQRRASVRDRLARP